MEVLWMLLKDVLFHGVSNLCLVLIRLFQGRLSVVTMAWIYRGRLQMKAGALFSKEARSLRLPHTIRARKMNKYPVTAVIMMVFDLTALDGRGHMEP